MMKRTKLSLENLLDQVTGCHEREAVLGELLLLRSKRRYRCSSAAILAYNMMLELYSEGSSDKANVERIGAGLEMAAAELRQLSQRLRWLGR